MLKTKNTTPKGWKIRSIADFLGTPTFAEVYSELQEELKQSPVDTGKVEKLRQQLKVLADAA